MQNSTRKFGRMFQLCGMEKKKLNVQGLSITLEQIGEADYISLTDIARRTDSRTDILIASWMKNSATLEFLEAWETLHNPAFKSSQMAGFKEKYLQNRRVLTPQTWIAETAAIGLISQKGRYGGTLAHKDIALNFCYWLSPTFQVYLIKEFQRLKEEEFNRKSLEWHIERITNLVDETRNWLDTIPGQHALRNRLGVPGEKPAEH
jgi:hypothetical protein